MNTFPDYVFAHLSHEEFIACGERNRELCCIRIRPKLVTHEWSCQHGSNPEHSRDFDALTITPQVVTEWIHEVHLYEASR